MQSFIWVLFRTLLLLLDQFKEAYISNVPSFLVLTWLWLPYLVYRVPGEPEASRTVRIFRDISYSPLEGTVSSGLCHGFNSRRSRLMCCLFSRFETFTRSRCSMRLSIHWYILQPRGVTVSTFHLSVSFVWDDVRSGAGVRWWLSLHEPHPLHKGELRSSVG